MEDPVIHIRRYRGRTGSDESFSCSVPTCPSCTSPDEKVVQNPLVCLSSASPPVQYCTAYFRAYGLAQAMRMAVISCGDSKSTKIHCGCSTSSSFVNLRVK